MEPPIRRGSAGGRRAQPKAVQTPRQQETQYAAPIQDSLLHSTQPLAAENAGARQPLSASPQAQSAAPQLPAATTQPSPPAAQRSPPLWHPTAVPRYAEAAPQLNAASSDIPPPADISGLVHQDSGGSEQVSMPVIVCADEGFVSLQCPVIVILPQQFASTLFKSAR